MRLLLRFWRHFQGLIPGQDFLSVYQLQFDFGTQYSTPPSLFFCSSSSILLATQWQANQAGSNKVLACCCRPEHTSRAQETTRRHCTQTTVTRLYPHIYSVSCGQAAQLSHQQRQNEWRGDLITPTDVETLLTATTNYKHPSSFHLIYNSPYKRKTYTQNRYISFKCPTGIPGCWSKCTPCPVWRYKPEHV